MTVLPFPAVSLSPVDLTDQPLADNVFFVLLRDHPQLQKFGLTVELAHEASRRRPPYVRTGVTRYRETPSRHDSTPISGVDVYATTDLAAGDIARRIASVWSFIKKLPVPSERAYVSGAWVDLDPVRLPEPTASAAGEDLARFHLELGLRLHPLPS